MPVYAHQIVKIPISEANILWAAETALKKLPHTDRGFDASRNMLDNLFQGDLAKNALIDYLTNLGYNITDEYDRVRNDNFNRFNNRGYVFKMNENRVEVNSSKLPNGYNTPASIINNLDLKVTYKDRFNNLTYPSDLKYEYSFQLYFHINPDNRTDYQGILDHIRARNYNEITDLIPLLIEELDVYNRYVDNLYGYCYVTPMRVEEIRQQNIMLGRDPYWNFPRADHTWWRCPISECFSFDTL